MSYLHYTRLMVCSNIPQLTYYLIKYALAAVIWYIRVVGNASASSSRDGLILAVILVCVTLVEEGGIWLAVGRYRKGDKVRL